jgi:hypothetical protein
MAKRFQFSIRWILAGTMAVACAAGLWVAKPSWQLGLIELVLVFFVPAFAAVASHDARGYARAFWIGVVVTTVLGSCMSFVAMLPQINWTIDDWQSARRFFARFAPYGQSTVFFWSFAPPVGILCVLARWLLGKKGGEE